MSKALELARHLETLHINNMYKNCRARLGGDRESVIMLFAV